MAKKMNITVYFDMDGCLVDLYGVKDWLEMLLAEDTTPYEIGKPLVRLATLARLLNKLQRNGYNLAIISWLSKGGSADYNTRVTKAKLDWLKKHLPSVTWDRITIIEYGTPKENYCENPLDILFDDEEKNRENWTGIAYDVNDILKVLKAL